MAIPFNPLAGQTGYSGRVDDFSSYPGTSTQGEASFNTADLFQKAMFDMINTKYGPPKASGGLAKGGGPLFGQYAEYQTVPTGVQPFAASDYSKRFLRPGINY